LKYIFNNYGWQKKVFALGIVSITCVSYSTLAPPPPPLDPRLSTHIDHMANCDILKVYSKKIKLYQLYITRYSYLRCKNKRIIFRQTNNKILSYLYTYLKTRIWYIITGKLPLKKTKVCIFVILSSIVVYTL